MNAKFIKALRSLHFSHWIILTLSLLLTFFASSFSQKQLNEKNQLRFDRAADLTVEHIVERLRKYEDALWAGTALLKANNLNINYAQWTKYANSLDLVNKYPGINGIGVIYNIQHKDKKAFIKKQRADNRPKFKIYPEHTQAELFPITYIIPLKGNQEAVGLDMAHENNRFTAAKKARASGKAQITGPIVLVQDKGKTPGFLFYAPFYNKDKQFVGLVYAPFVVKKLMDGVLSKDKRAINIKITDGSSTLFADSMMNTNPYSTFKKEKQINLYGRPWKIELSSNELFFTTNTHAQPLTILICGIIIDIILLCMFIQMSYGKELAVHFSNKATKELKINAIKLSEAYKSLEEKTQQIQAVFDASIHNCIIATDATGTIKFINAGAETMLGFTKSQLVGKPFLSFISEIDKCNKQQNHPDSFEALIETIKGNGASSDMSLKRYDTKTLEVSSTLATTSDADSHIEYIFIASDISERKQVEKIKNDFISTVNHEIRTPLTSIQAGIGVVIQHYEKLNKEKIIDTLEIAKQSCNRLLHLINNILDIRKIEEQGFTVNKKNISINKLLGEVAASNKALANKKQQKILIHENNDFVIHTDQQLLYVVIENLISNASKFSPENTSIEINTDFKNHEFILKIADQGPGIPEEFKGKLFNKFSQADASNTRSNQHGSGLGLNLCKNIMANLNGRIWFECPETGGTTFYITLPA